MDAAAISLARENHLPIVVFNIHAPGAFAQVMRGEGAFTRIVEQPTNHTAGADHGMPADLNSLKQDLTRRMDGALDTLKREFAGLRTGRAHPGLLEPVKVRRLRHRNAAQPGRHRRRAGAAHAHRAGLGPVAWSRAVEKAIRDSGLGLNPAADGQLVRVPIPQLTAERRNELAKTAHKYAEGARSRGARRAARRHGADQGAGEEARDRRGRRQELADEVQKLTDQYIKRVDEALVDKEKEIRQV